MGELSRKDSALLDRIRTMSDGGRMYPGMPMEMAPRRANRLHREGLLTIYIPHNPVHKERWVITPAGRAALEEHTDG